MIMVLFFATGSTEETHVPTNSIRISVALLEFHPRSQYKCSRRGPADRKAFKCNHTLLIFIFRVLRPPDTTTSS